ncbi:FCD domain-containing protein [Propionimicrobium sp. PCR01-08-3]|uniref:FadR/GntR family transcriptional regulator n=1 Tax=Propionimicrobium sp. PCR01-08-3 TaxID=3052086 RepID=UPI00255CE162|nr:FCD domain-containing protein [Propionimicrobium sp. PCR01-08-3]WIY81739.1 FCD domain-containing protein [Propionimicrobium sp. PCR01-08-3]
MPSGNVFHTVLQQVAMEIVDGRLEAGARLTLSDVEEKFGISRTLARDVVKALESVGLLVAKRRAGIQVLPKSQWSVLDAQVIEWRLESDEKLAQITSLTELRRGIEPMAAGLASQRRSDEQADQLVALADDLKALGERGLGRSDKYLQTDIEFHSLLLEASGNEMLIAMRGMIVEVLRGRSIHGLMPVTPEPGALLDHSRIAKAIAERDDVVAETVSRRQMDGLQTELSSSG